VALTAREPLNMLHKSTRKLDWRARPEDIWNYFVFLEPSRFEQQFAFGRGLIQPVL